LRADLRSGSAGSMARKGSIRANRGTARKSGQSLHSGQFLYTRRGALRCPGGSTVKKKESADKPGSVEDNHSSAIRVAAYLQRPTREHVWATRAAPIRGRGRLLPYLVLLRAGFAVPPSVATGAVRSYRTLSPLPPPLQGGWRFAFCCTFRGLAPPRRYLAPCPGSPDFPPRLRAAIAWPTPAAILSQAGETGAELEKLVPGEKNDGKSAAQQSWERCCGAHFPLFFSPGTGPIASAAS
jgi:hypothetical protein